MSELAEKIFQSRHYKYFSQLRESVIKGVKEMTAPPFGILSKTAKEVGENVDKLESLDTGGNIGASATGNRLSLSNTMTL